MKRIIKQHSPQWFETWKDMFRVNNGREPHYKGDFSTDSIDGANRRKRLKGQLIEEQGCICCYCMKRISQKNTHIEHFHPKDAFKEEDLIYENLFASCNGEGEILEQDEHCGHRKDNWYREDMISPIDPEVERMFKYSLNGHITSRRDRSSSNIAQEMIENFGLDTYNLVRSRREAIEASEVFDEEEYSPDEIRSFIEYYSEKDNGKYVPYCKAIVDCLQDIL